MIPSSRPKLSDLYILSQSKLLENHTLHSGTCLYSPYMAVPPRALPQIAFDDGRFLEITVLLPRYHWMNFHFRFIIIAFFRISF